MKKLLHKLSPICIAVLPSVFLFQGCDMSVTKNEEIKTVEATPEEESEALQAVKKFLYKLDEGDFNTWDDLSEIVKKETSKTEWNLLTKTMRKASGKNIKRSSYGSACTESLPNAPKGRYFVFDINSTFERTELIERVVAVFEDDTWKIGGYHMSKKIS